MLQTKKINNGLSLQPDSNLISVNFGGVRDAFINALGQEPASVVLDLEKVEQVDAYGLALIVGLFKSLQRESRELKLINVHPELMALFDLIHLNRYFEIKEKN